MSPICEKPQSVCLLVEPPSAPHWLVVSGRSLLCCLGPIRSGYDVLRMLLAVLLLTAAALKAYQLSTSPILGSTLVTSRWFLIGLVQFELLFGVWLLSGVWPSLSWYVAIVCFAAFAPASLIKALSGDTSCGCFGRVAVNPWLMFALDVAAVVLLLCCFPGNRRSFLPMAAKSRRRGPALLVGAWFLLGVPVFAFLVYSSTVARSDVGIVVGGGRAVVLTPDRWVGKRFPLLGYIDTGTRLDRGDWLVVLYRSDCAKCRNELPRYIEEASRAANERTGWRLSIVELPPFMSVTPSQTMGATPYVKGRLKDITYWRVEIPLEVRVRDGVTMSVKQADRRGAPGPT